MVLYKKRLSVHTGIRLLSAVGAAGVMTLLMLGSLLAAAEPGPSSGRPESVGLRTVASDSSGRDGQVGSPAALPPAQKGGITTTGRTPPLPGWAEDLLDESRIGPADASISISKSVNTATVFDGDRITYTIILTNHTAGAIANVEVLDILPRDNEGNIQVGGPVPCSDGCEIIYVDPITYEQAGTVYIVELDIPDQISWTLASLAPGVKELTFSVRVACQPVGAVLKNRSLFFYSGGGGSSNETQTTVAARPPDQSGGFALAPEPIWCSSEVPSAYDLDGGDFDGDGDLDLALGSLAGTTVYRNDGSQFTEVEINNLFTYGTRWADLDRNGDLELLSVGQWVYSDTFIVPPDPFQAFLGINYVYPPGAAGFGSPSIFYSDNGFYRVAPADYDSDGDLDLASTIFWYGGVGTCKLRLYRNNSGTFSDFTNGTNACLVDGFGNGLRSIAWGDYDNDGYPDLASGRPFPGGVQIFRNNSGSLVTPGIVVDSSSTAYDLAWGDYNNDGFLDLAAAFGNEIRIYKNDAGSWSGAAIETLPSASVYGVDWGDFNGDGQVDLVAGNTIYEHTGGDSFASIAQANTGNNTLYTVRSLDHDNDGDPDLAIANLSNASLLYPSFSPRLVPSLTSVGSFASSSVAWGDIEGDSDLDLLLGAASGSTSRLYGNNQANFSFSRELLSYNGTGPHKVAFGDVNGNGSLEIALGSSNGLQVYVNSDEFPDWDYSTAAAIRSLAWGDVEGDGDLDLLAGTNGPNLLFFNQGTGLASSPGWQSTSEVDDDTRSVAWGDYNNDFYLDFATGNANRPTRVYRNNKNNTFSLAWSSPYSWDSRSVAWGDYDQDGDLDLAVGNYNQPNLIYRNQGGSFSLAWSSPVSQTTTGLAWGDWDNDGDLDLAVGNEDHQDRVYENLNTETGSPTLIWRWTSPHNYATTGLAWGDQDGDGDLDLAVSRSDGNSGVYKNSYVSPSHLTTLFTPTMPLPNNPAYLSIARPGSTGAAYFFSSAEILNSSIIPIPFTVFDPDGTRSGSNLNAWGDDLIPMNEADVLYEYSLNGGGEWQPATIDSLAGPGGREDTRRQGQSYIFYWNAEADRAISDNARFRIGLINHIGPTQDTSVPDDRAGLNQRARVSAVSPPFRIRPIITNCSWPSNPSIIYNPLDPMANSPVDFFGNATNVGGSGNLTFTWDFGDGSNPPNNSTQNIEHTYISNGVYTVTLTVSGEPCPVPYEVIASQVIMIGASPLSNPVFLPLVQKSGVSGVGTETGPAAGGQPFTLAVTPESPAQVTGLTGSTQLEAGVTRLEWNLSPSEEAVLGYRVYRASDAGPAYLQADLPANISTYTDNTATCGQLYFVTAYSDGGESLPSTTSYVSQACRPPAPSNPPTIELESGD